MSEVQAGKCKAYLAESVLAECVFILTKYYLAPKGEAAARLGELLDYKGLYGNSFVKGTTTAPKYFSSF